MSRTCYNRTCMLFHLELYLFYLFQFPMFYYFFTLFHFVFSSFFTMNFIAVYQTYETRVADEFVIIGNDALIKCSLPSFAADFLQVVGWVTDQGYAIDSTSVDGNIHLQTDVS